MAKTSTIENKLSVSEEVFPGDGAGNAVLIKKETNKGDIYEFYDTLEEAQTAKAAWDD
jgi:hypothetical protein